MKILLTGSNGFIGRHVCKYLRDRNIYVIGLGRTEKSIPDVDEYICCDLGTNQLESVNISTKIDAVIHLAADMRKDPYCIEVVQDNCAGTQRLLEYCEKNNISTFLQLSSLPVIGKPRIHPILENHPLCPPTVYHVTKVTEELLADYAYRLKGIRTASFRISAPVGWYMNEKTIFPTLVRNALDNKEIILYGKGTRKQTYIHVEDIAQALYKGLFSNNCNGVYNLSSKNLISNYDLAKLIIQSVDSKSQIIFSDKEDLCDNDVWDVSIEKIEADIGYKPEKDITDCITTMVNFYKK